MTNHSTTLLRIAIAQMNPIVGDVAGNIAKIYIGHHRATGLGADLIVFPELFVSGYLLEDLVSKRAFVQSARTAVEQLAKKISDKGPAVLVGTVWPEENEIYNAVVLLQDGIVKAVRYKTDLPNYGVFDEKRVFAAGPLPNPINFRGVRLGVPICEDIWNNKVCTFLAKSGAELFLVPNASPFDRDKPNMRMAVSAARVKENKLAMAYVNQIGGQDELVFDGASFVLNNDAKLVVQLPAWQEDVALTEWKINNYVWNCTKSERTIIPAHEAAVYHACMTGLRDYVDKNCFPGVVLGLSGGIDSALVAALAVDAFGKNRVHCVMLPFHFTSEESLKDAAMCAEALEVRYDIIPIEAPVISLRTTLATMFTGLDACVTEENIQSRVRGTILMAISNKFGSLVLTTGNKSEIAVGYTTLYGDMNGGYNPIKDVYKSEIYKIAAWRNSHVPLSGQGPDKAVIPRNILIKPPTAELRDNQTDQDNLPPYNILDGILNCVIEQDMSVQEIISKGYDKNTVIRVTSLVKAAEHKRRQAAPGTKISTKNFGRDRRYPITNLFSDNIKK
ncbi:MAG: NAD+ synthase [Hyphomicrobiaceae bacterium]|nr:NAD+ synthase [Hyphomicrobiaceae bacterium]